MVLPSLTAAGYLFPPAATSETLNPNFGRINATLWQASSFYDAMQVDLAKRVSRVVSTASFFRSASTAQSTQAR